MKLYSDKTKKLYDESDIELLKKEEAEYEEKLKEKRERLEKEEEDRKNFSAQRKKDAEDVESKYKELAEIKKQYKEAMLVWEEKIRTAQASAEKALADFNHRYGKYHFSIDNGVFDWISYFFAI